MRRTGWPMPSTGSAWPGGLGPASMHCQRTLPRSLPYTHGPASAVLTDSCHFLFDVYFSLASKSLFHFVLLVFFSFHFVLPLSLVLQVKPKMVMTVFAALMSYDFKANKAEAGLGL